MFLKRSVHTICIAVMKAIQQYINTGCQKDSSNIPLYVKLTDKSLWTGFQVQVLLVFADIVS